MPIVVCVEVTEKTKAEIDELLKLGDYKDFSEAVSVAVANQLLLQRRAQGCGAFVLEEAISGAPHERASGPAVSVPGSSQRPAVRVPAVFSFTSAQACEIEPAPLPGDAFPKGAKVPIERWFFGQHNKLLPAKASCRALAALLAERPLGVALENAGAQIAQEAAGLGEFLRHLDARSGASREEALATAFPYPGPDSGKSRLRYANQFVGALNTRDQLSGLLVDLKLINYLRGKRPMLLLTEPGVQFAKLLNPVLDEPVRSNGSSQPKFTGEEIGFLLGHIRERVPVEDFAFRAILGALRAGINTPEELDRELLRLFPAGKKGVSMAFVATQRSGVISRMVDLEMVLRKREGIRVRYEPTQRGLTHLSETTGVSHEQ